MKKISFLFFGLIFSFAFLNAQYEIGDKVNDFKLKNIDGSYVSLSDYDDAKGIILVFTCNTCPFAIKYEDRIIELHNDFASKGYHVIAVNPNSVRIKPDDSMEKMKERAKKKDYGFVYLRDDDQEVAKSYGAERTPEIFLLEKSGNDFVLRYTGTIDNNVDNASKADEHYVRDAVNALLSNKDIAMTQTRAIGCTIKWN